jgi:integrase
LLTAAQTGLRASELRGLRWADVDLQTEPSLHVRQRVDRWKVIGPPKSDAAIRTVPLSPDLIEALTAWKLKCPKTGAPGPWSSPAPAAKCCTIPTCGARSTA